MLILPWASYLSPALEQLGAGASVRIRRSPNPFKGTGFLPDMWPQSESVGERITIAISEAVPPVISDTTVLYLKGQPVAAFEGKEKEGLKPCE